MPLPLPLLALSLLNLTAFQGMRQIYQISWMSPLIPGMTAAFCHRTTPPPPTQPHLLPCRGGVEEKSQAIAIVMVMSTGKLIIKLMEKGQQKSHWRLRVNHKRM